MAETEQKIVVEVPSDRDRGHYSALRTPQHQNRLEEFKRGWVNAIALPDNLAELAFDLTSYVSIPALLTSFWVAIPFPQFVRLGLWAVLAVASGCLLYLRQSIPEIKDLLLLRVGLIAIGVLMGL